MVVSTAEGVLLDMAAEDMVTGQDDEQDQQADDGRAVETGPLSPASDSVDGSDGMVDKHHDSLIEDEPVQPAAVTEDGIFASSVQNLYDANG